ncbi:LmeA family phospholipid-binding protein [Gulosibacter sp. ACHW.36C]|uniref:DUF2993 domain-containing protein n=1 Tax=Gulosibacter sediminis TaxID=1729695 RepID=A0ABY4MZM9_9MICO|nr:LmeA family phospholipid-binding protein [Gulosibacter sediminis]UQN15903.1 DUF2993 domain-containing protein [Gulosibacter sediminis]
MAATRRRARPGIVAAIIVIAVVVLLVVVEIVARVLVGRITANQVEQSLPDGLSADVSAAATGTCVTCELLGGTISGIHVTSDDVTFGDVTGAASVDAHDVKLGSPISVGSLNGSIGIDEDELNALLQEVAAQSGIEIHSIELRDDGISYGTEIEVFGETVGLSVVANLEPRSGGRLRVVAEQVSITSGIGSAQVDLDADRFSFEMCLAEHLPAEVQLTSVQPSAQHVDISFRSTKAIPLDDTAFAELGSCT